MTGRALHHLTLQRTKVALKQTRMSQKGGGETWQSVYSLPCSDKDPYTIRTDDLPLPLHQLPSLLFTLLG